MLRVWLALAVVMLCGVPVSAAEVESGERYCFSAGDFSGEADFSGICVTDVPREGALRLGGREVRPGDILTAGQIGEMTFAAGVTEQDGTARMGYLPVFRDRVEEEAEMTIGIRGKENQAPVAEDQAAETYKNQALTEKLKAKDPEGEALVYEIVKGPKRGEAAISEDGSFTYQPKKNKVGVDSFTYRATDPAGKVSREARVTVTILKPVK